MPDAPAAAAPAGTAPPETFHVTDRSVACDGGGGALGHPRVWLRIAGTEVVCPYCSRLFILEPGAGSGDH